MQQAAVNAAKDHGAGLWAAEHTSDRTSDGYLNAEDVETGGLGPDGKPLPRVNPYAAMVAAIPQDEIASMKVCVCVCMCMCMYIYIYIYIDGV